MTVFSITCTLMTFAIPPGLLIPGQVHTFTLTIWSTAKEVPAMLALQDSLKVKSVILFATLSLAILEFFWVPVILLLQKDNILALTKV
jgi:hypothetical protein